MAACLSQQAMAQVGEYRNRFSVGASAGYVLNSISFLPKVVQGMHGGMTFGITGRYTSEKYFSTLCAIQGEVNVVSLGWKQDILTINDEPVVNPVTQQTEEYQRDMTYIQIPIFAHLSWGKETNGFCGFVNLGPQFGYLMSEKTSKNYDLPFTSANFPDSWNSEEGRVSQVEEQETMDVENKIDYGITVGAGVEWSHKHIGRLALEGRFYYGLGNLYGDSKRDYFAASNHTTIVIKLTYMHDL